MPFGKAAVIYQVMMTLLPALPLVLLVVPMSEIVAVLSKLAL